MRVHLSHIIYVNIYHAYITYLDTSHSLHVKLVICLLQVYIYIYIIQNILISIINIWNCQSSSFPGCARCECQDEADHRELILDAHDHRIKATQQAHDDGLDAHHCLRECKNSRSDVFETSNVSTFCFFIEFSRNNRSRNQCGHAGLAGQTGQAGLVKQAGLAGVAGQAGLAGVVGTDLMSGGCFVFLMNASPPPPFTGFGFGVALAFAFFPAFLASMPCMPSSSRT